MQYYAKLMAKALAIFLLLMGCEGDRGEDGPQGLNSLVESIEEPVGSNCVFGGLRIIAGVDTNGNDILDTNEIMMTEFACNGANAKTTLTSFVTETAGANCSNGGLQLNFGIDQNENGILDQDEMETVVYLCNGLDANTTLSKITNLPEGPECETGGLKIDSGLDINGNLQLDLDEITNTSFLCNGNNGIKSLININPSDVSEDCSQGGLIIQSGQDTNENNSLDDEEILITRTICNGIDGIANEEIRILILSIGGGFSGFSTAFVTDLLNFNIQNWDRATAVYLSATIASTSSSSIATAELSDQYGDVIPNSRVSTNSTEFVTLLSENFLNGIPEQEITLRLLLQSELSGEYVNITGKTELIIIQQN